MMLNTQPVTELKSPGKVLTLWVTLDVSIMPWSLNTSGFLQSPGPASCGLGRHLQAVVFALRRNFTLLLIIVCAQETVQQTGKQSEVCLLKPSVKQTVLIPAK